MAHLPPGSTTWARENGVTPGLSLTDVLLADVFAALTGEVHPLMEPILKAAERDAAKDKVAALIEQKERLKRKRARESEEA